MELTREVCLQEQGRIKDYINGKIDNLRDYVDDEIEEVCLTTSNEIKEIREDLKWIFKWVIGLLVTVVILLAGILIEMLLGGITL